MENMEVHVDREAVRENRGWLFALAVALIALGVVAVAAAFAATLASVLLFGVLLLVGGVAQLAEALSSRSEDFAWELGGGILYTLTGGLLVLDPVSGAVGLTLLLGVFFVFIGVVRIALGLRRRRVSEAGGPWILAGALDLALGAIIAIGWPDTSAWVLGLLLGVELIFAGICLAIVTRSVSSASIPAHRA